ncbi:zinc-binding protein A33-like [Engraulis encrasicolus]|uniref:zinc-binding protein A33-like n=1 Tax=Engraulis encrasicolus TaxID=184585 RepID=UPI002FD5440E
MDSFPVENLTCTICHDIFTDPVSLKCSHTFCQECLRQYWKDRDVLLCPVCRKECSSEEPTQSLAFKDLCESVKIRSAVGLPVVQLDQLCPLHGEKVKLFCVEDKQSICVICHTSKRHKNHTCSPIEEVVEDLKQEIEGGLTTFHQSLHTLKQREDELQNISTHMQNQAESAELHIIKQFEKLHTFLNVQEAVKLQALRDEKEKKSRAMEDRMERLRGEISTLQETIETIKKEMASDHIQFLQSYYSSPHRLQCETEEPENLSGCLINMVQHVCSLNHQLWTESYQRYNPMVLDPNTAAPKLIISEDLTSLTYTEDKQKVPEIPERFIIGVLGSKGFTTGRHSWDVEVGDNDFWVLGVVKKSVCRKKLMKFQPEGGIYCIRYISGKYRVGVKAKMEIKVTKSPQMIRIELDYERGQITFSDPSADVTLCTFNHAFNEKLSPYFSTGSLKCPLRLCFPEQP